MTAGQFVPFASYREYPPEEMRERAASFRSDLRRRRSVRDFSSRPGFLNAILGRPENERPSVVLVVGYPADGATVPDIRKKTLAEIVTFL